MENSTPSQGKSLSSGFYNFNGCLVLALEGGGCVVGRGRGQGKTNGVTIGGDTVEVGGEGQALK